MVAKVPDNEPRTPSRKLRQRAYQLVDEPESAVTIASDGSRSESSQAIRIGFTGLADNLLCRSRVSHQRPTFSSIVSRQDLSCLRCSNGISSSRVAAAPAKMLSSVG